MELSYVTRCSMRCRSEPREPWRTRCSCGVICDGCSSSATVRWNGRSAWHDVSAGPGMTSLLWLRRDLRLHDLPALRVALDAGREVIPVFCFDPQLVHGRHAS